MTTAPALPHFVLFFYSGIHVIFDKDEDENGVRDLHHSHDHHCNRLANNFLQVILSLSQHCVSEPQVSADGDERRKG